MTQGISRRTLIKAGGAAALGATSLPLLSRRSSAQNQDPIRLGFLAPLSGPNDVVGTDMVTGATIAVDQINKDGGIMGRKIELVVRDDRAEPAAAVAAAKELIGAGANVMGGVFASAAALALGPVLQSDGGVIVVTAPSNTAVTQENFNKHVFRVCDMAYMRNRALAKLLAGNFPDVTRWSCVGAQVGTGQAGWAAFEDGLLQYYPEVAGKDVTIVDPVWAKYGAPDYKNEVMRAMRLDADGLFFILFGGDAITFFKQAQPFGFAQKFKVIADPGTEWFIVDALKEQTPQGFWSSFHWYYGAYKGHKISDDLYNEYVARTGNKRPQGYVGEAHSTILALVHAIQKAQTTDTQAVISALEGLTFDSCKGMRTLRAEDHQAIVDTNFVQFGPDETSETGYKVLSYEIVKGADVAPPPTPGKPVELKYSKRT